MARDTILVVDDDEMNTDLIKIIFQDDYKVVACHNGKEALSYLTKEHKSIAIIMLDLVMPVVDGSVLLRVLHSKKITKIIPVVIITSDTDPDTAKQCYSNGAIDFIQKPFVSTIVKGRVNNIITLFKNKRELEAVVNEQTSLIKEKNQALKDYNDKILETMGTAIEFRNLESFNHIRMIKEMTYIIGDMLRHLYPEEYNFTDKEIKAIKSASALHDIGKMTVSDSILLKPGRLTPEEFEVIKSHTTKGCEMLEKTNLLSDESYMKLCYNICRHHHERFDGKGYPDNLKGDDIPIEAQIVSIADAYASLRGDREYRDAYEKEEAFDMIIKGECGAFSDKIIKSFSKAKPLLEKVVDDIKGES